MGFTPEGYNKSFEDFRTGILNLDPVQFIQNNLTLDGKPFRLEGNGYKPFADIYRYIGIKAIEQNSKPVVLVKGRQVGATTMAAALECYFGTCGIFGSSGRAPARMIHLFPTLGLAAAYVKDKLDPVIQQAKPVPGTLKANGLNKSFVENKLDSSSPANNNQSFKKFINGNQVWIESTGLAGDRIRGRTCDIALFDEVQDMPDIAIGAVTKILAQSRYGMPSQGVQVYFGTPKMKGGSYYKMWQDSSQQYYHLKCEKCGEYFPLYRPDVNWEDIWIHGHTVRCTHCQHEQDKRGYCVENGKWLSMNPDEDATYIGFHINQLYIPAFTKEAIEKAKPENSAINTERLYMNEVLGEFFDGEGGTLSYNELEEAGAEDRKMDRYLPPKYEKKVYAGFDWGQRSALEQIAGRGKGQSYSCAVILTADGPNLFSVRFATRLKKNDMAEKIEVVEEMFRRFNTSIAVGDIGDAGDISHELQKKFPENFIVSRACPQVKGYIKYDQNKFPKEIDFERDYYIGEILSLLKNGNIKFPWKDHDRIGWLVNHCCSMDVKVTRDRKGDPKKHYVKGSGPNDGLMALLNAYIAWKYDVTQGFKIKQPHNMQYEKAMQKKPIPAIVGYCPRLKMM